MASFIKKVFNLDRRIIFLFIFLSVLIPLMIDFKLPIKAGRNVQIVYDKIETVAAKNGTILVSFDFDTASKPELEPMARAVIAHAMMRNVKVVAMGNWPNGVELAKETMRSLAKEYNKVEGTDWTYLGYKPGAAIVIINMGDTGQDDIADVFMNAPAGETMTKIMEKLRAVKS